MLLFFAITTLKVLIYSHKLRAFSLPLQMFAI